MDSLTHVVLGAAIGEAVLGKKLGRKAMLWGALADTIPDFDVFVAILFPPPENLLLHRGITHSLFFVTLATPLLAWLFRKIYRASDIHFWIWSHKRWKRTLPEDFEALRKEQQEQFEARFALKS